MNDENKVICISCLEECNIQDTQPRAGGRQCDMCNAMEMTSDLEDEKALNFDEVNR